MILRKNIIYNLGSNIFITLLLLITTPIFLHVLSAEKYGYLAFLVLLLNWVSAFDSGFTKVIMKFATVYINNSNQFNKIFSTYFFLLSILVVFLSLFIFLFSSEYFSWLKVRLEPNTNNLIMSFIFLIFILKIYYSYYKSALQGFEDQAYISKLNVVLTTVRQVFGLTICQNLDILSFFIFITLTHLIELVIIYKRLNKKYNCKITFLDFDLLYFKNTKSLFLSVFCSTLIYLFLNQFDKLYYSRNLSISNFSYISVGLMLSSTLLLFTQSIQLAVQPLYTKLVKKRKFKLLYLINFNLTLLFFLFSLFITFLVSNNSYLILYLWTGNDELSNYLEDKLFYFFLVNSIISVASLNYLLQISFSKMTLHLVGTILLTIISIPSIIYIFENYGITEVLFFVCFLRILWYATWHQMILSYLFKIINYNYVTNIIIPIFFFFFLLDYLLNFLTLSYYMKLVSSIFLFTSLLIFVLNFNKRILFTIYYVSNRY